MLIFANRSLVTVGRRLAPIFVVFNKSGGTHANRYDFEWMRRERWIGNTLNSLRHLLLRRTRAQRPFLRTQSPTNPSHRPLIGKIHCRRTKHSLRIGSHCSRTNSPDRKTQSHLLRCHRLPRWNGRGHQSSLPR